MGRPALGAHISSNWWECPSARSVAVAVDRSWMPWAAVASTSGRAPCQVAMLF